MRDFIEKLIERLEELQNYACFPREFVSEEQEEVYSFFRTQLTEILEFAKEYSHCTKSSCSDCEVYDTEKHYCPKWCEVIKNTVAEIEENHNGWIPCSERLPEIWTPVLVCNKEGRVFVRQINWISQGQTKIPYWSQYSSGIIAWQPLPAPYVQK